MTSPAVAIVGATASGKSAVALEVARFQLDVEIISVDSMAVYRGMDLGTAKPPLSVRQEIPHHMIDILDPHEECTVSLFQERAQLASKQIAERGHRALYVGGTGLYHRAVIDQLDIPGQFPEIKQRLEQEAETETGRDCLYGRLKEHDPLAAERIDPQNTRRLVRALEVLDGSGAMFSSYGPGLEAYPENPIIQIGLDVNLDELDRRAEERVRSWVAQGFIDEVQSLADRSQGISRTARQAIGYREFLDWGERGGDQEIPIQATIGRTQKLIRRQRSWFRRDPRVQWVNSADEAVLAVLAAFDAPGTAVQ